MVQKSIHNAWEFCTESMPVQKKETKRGKILYRNGASTEKEIKRGKICTLPTPVQITVSYPEVVLYIMVPIRI